MKKDDYKKGEILIYKTEEDGVGLDVRLEKNTVWLTQAQMAELFQKSPSTISEHISNVFEEGELEKELSIRKFGNSEIGLSKPTNYYNLDVIISVGYRVKSHQGTHFRIWATKTLTDHLIRGFTVNKRLLFEAQDKFQELQSTIAFLQEKSQRKLLRGQEAEILNLLASYTKTLSTLEAYDKGALVDVRGKKTRFVLSYDECERIIQQIKTELIARKEAGDLFGNDRDNTFIGIVRGLTQTFNQKELYSTIEDKAAHLLYLTIKDHPFSDGNKRIASFLFIYFLDRAEYLYKKSGERKINDNALTALALLIAESDPQEKEVMIKIVKTLISE
jgi:death-on-curing family protein